MRRWRAAVLAVCTALLLSGCSAGLSDSGQPLTIEQADTLAQVRFRLAAGGDAVVALTAGKTDSVDHVSATLTVDFDDGIAWGEVKRGPEGIAVTEHLAFNPKVCLVEKDGVWQQESSPSPIMAVVFGMGADRPENSTLLRQSDARYLGQADDDGVELQVFRSPSVDGQKARTRLWVDEHGALRRLDAGDDDALVIRPTDAKPAARIPAVDQAFGAHGD